MASIFKNGGGGGNRTPICSYNILILFIQFFLFFNQRRSSDGLLKNPFETVSENFESYPFKFTTVFDFLLIAPFGNLPFHTSKNSFQHPNSLIS
jgi:hypothetical protein